MQEIIDNNQKYIDILEKKYTDSIPHIKSVRELRLLDKILWCSGKK
jgi:hypothetical protein